MSYGLWRKRSQYAYRKVEKYNSGAMYDYILYYHIGLVIAVVLTTVLIPLAMYCENKNNAYLRWAWPLKRYIWATGELIIGAVATLPLMYVLSAPIVWIVLILDLVL